MIGPPPGPKDVPSWPQLWALFLDIDGTLLDLAPTPESVQVPPGLPRQLRSLADRLDGALALVSGRPLRDIDWLVPEGLDAAGTHGAEWRLGGELMEVGLDGLDAMASAAEALQARARQMPGVRVEIKPLGLALHYRLAPDREAETRLLAEQAVQTLGPAFRLQAGKHVVEILPAGAGKGEAIRRFMDCPPYAGRVPVFAGDDLTDEDGFAAVNALGGISIRIGEADRTQARYRLGAPADVQDWLSALAPV
jgi:trehalose 6-phosphate phosphatase